MSDWARPLLLLRQSHHRLRETRLAQVLILSVPVLAVLDPKASVILFLVLAGLAMGLDAPRRRFGRFLRTPVVLLLGALLIWYGITALWSPDVGEGLWRSLRTLVMVAAGLAVLALLLSAAAADRAAVDRALAWSGVLFPVLFLAGLAGCHLLPPWLSDVGTVCKEPPFRHAAVQLGALALPFTLVLWRRWGGLAAVLFLGVTAVGLAGHPKVAAIIALGIGLIAFALVYAGRRAGLVLLAGTLTLGALLAPQATAFVVEQPAVQARAPSLPFSWQHRLAIWARTVGQIAERPLIGYGAGFHRYLREIEGPRVTLYDEGKPKVIALSYHHPHSTFLQVWLETGGVGAVLLAACFAAFWRRLLRAGLSRVDLALAAAVVTSWFVISATDFDPWETRWVAGQLTMLVVTATIIVRPRLRGSEIEPSSRWSGRDA